MNKLIHKKLFSTSPSQSAIPKEFRTLITSLQTCATKKNLKIGKQIHTHMLKNQFLLHQPFCITSLINLYSKCNHPHTAFTVFNNTHILKNVYMYNAVIAGFVLNGLSKHGVELYKRMRVKDAVLPDKYTFPVVIKACCDVGEVVEVGLMHGNVLKLGLDRDRFVVSALVNFYLKFGFMVEARGLFEEMGDLEKDVVLWNAMINGYAQKGFFDEALDVFRRMLDEGGGVVPSKFTVTGVLSVFGMKKDLNNGRVVHCFVKKIGYESEATISNSLIDMYGKCMSVADADEIFEEMGERDVFSWNSIISIHERSADYSGSMELFDRMIRGGFQPDIVTVTIALPACSHLAALGRGREIHGFMIKNGGNGGVSDVYLDNAIMDMYIKCGRLQDARTVFENMRDRDVASWNIMIMGYGMHGYGYEAVTVFSDMCKTHLNPDEVTFINILSACSHAGLLDHGCELLSKMEMDHGVVPSAKHYACVVDMLGRAGNLDEAYELVLRIPIESNLVVWRAFLAACQLHGNAHLAEIAAQKVFEIDPANCGGYVLMSNVFGSSGRYEDVSAMRKTMRTENVKKIPGCSWVELKTGVPIFAMRDHSHPASDLIYDELDSLTGNLCAHGYIPDVMHC